MVCYVRLFHIPPLGFVHCLSYVVSGPVKVKVHVLQICTGRSLPTQLVVNADNSRPWAT